MMLLLPAVFATYWFPGHHCPKAGSVTLLAAGCHARSPFGTSLLLLSPSYIIQPSPNCRRLLMHDIPCAFCFALDSAGSSIAASMAMMAMTTSSSINVKPDGFWLLTFIFFRIVAFKHPAQDRKSTRLNSSHANIS